MSSSQQATIEDIDDPIGYFLDDQRYHGKAERTISAYERVLRRFESFLESSPTATDSPEAATRRDCMAWIHGLRAEQAESTVATYASYLNRFYGYMTQLGVFDGNPMILVLEEMSESIQTDPTRRDLSVDQMRSFVTSVSHPLERALILTLLKTGIRVGELCNIDSRDMYMPSIDEEHTMGPPRGELEGRPDSLYIDRTPAYGHEYNGEVRSASNKRKRETIIPIDDELRSVLIRWISVRPDAVSAAEPLFVSTGDRWGRRLKPADVRYIVRKHAEQFGWYRPGGNAAENVTPHYFRHFFTTNLRDRTGDRGVVKYLRGDVADDIIDTYTHNWGDRVRSIYVDNIYQLLE